MNLREKAALDVAAENIERLCHILKFLEGKAGVDMHIRIADSGYRTLSCERNAANKLRGKELKRVGVERQKGVDVGVC